ncbi:uncharacterized protein ACO6RY_02496 [Pungitius sinensis]
MTPHTHTHTHLYSQGQLTTVHLFWTHVLSGSTAQVSGPSVMQRLPHLFLPPPPPPTHTQGRTPLESLLSLRRAANPLCVTVLCSAPFALAQAAGGPCHVFRDS